MNKESSQAQQNRCFFHHDDESTVSRSWKTMTTCLLQRAVVVSRYYGLSVWFPDVIKHLQADDYASRVKVHNNERIEDFTFNFTLENQIHRNSVFLNDR